MTISPSRMAVLSPAGAGLGAFLVVGRAEAAPETRKVVRQVDHVLISSSQPKALFALLTQTFELPVAWPMSDYGGFVSGGVALGNVNVEVLSAAGPAGGVARARFVGLALEPEPLPALPELDARGIVHGRPAPYRAGRSWFTRKPRWTTVALPTVSADALEVFLCEYGHDVAEQRQRLREQLQSRQGGPLSVRSVRRSCAAPPIGDKRKSRGGRSSIRLKRQMVNGSSGVVRRSAWCRPNATNSRN